MSCFSRRFVNTSLVNCAPWSVLKISGCVVVNETTGESCQVTSNQSDKWVGGHCPIAPEEQQQQERAFVEALCKDNPNSDSCKALLKEKQ
jgi:hypothetical protein